MCSLEHVLLLGVSVKDNRCVTLSGKEESPGSTGQNAG